MPVRECIGCTGQGKFNPIQLSGYEIERRDHYNNNNVCFVPGGSCFSNSPAGDAIATDSRTVQKTHSRRAGTLRWPIRSMCMQTI